MGDYSVRFEVVPAVLCMIMIAEDGMIVYLEVDGDRPDFQKVVQGIWRLRLLDLRRRNQAAFTARGTSRHHGAKQELIAV